MNHRQAVRSPIITTKVAAVISGSPITRFAPNFGSIRVSMLDIENVGCYREKLWQRILVFYEDCRILIGPEAVHLVDNSTDAHWAIYFCLAKVEN